MNHITMMIVLGLLAIAALIYVGDSKQDEATREATYRYQN